MHYRLRSPMVGCCSHGFDDATVSDPYVEPLHFSNFLAKKSRDTPAAQHTPPNIETPESTTHLPNKTQKPHTIRPQKHSTPSQASWGCAAAGCFGSPVRLTGFCQKALAALRRGCPGLDCSLLACILQINNMFA